MKAWQVAMVVLFLVAAFIIATGMRPSTVVVTNKEVKPKPTAIAWAKPVAPRAPHQAVVFRLDSTLTRGLYMGDRWVSPSTYFFAQPGNQYVVEAKAQEIDSRGERVDLSGEWQPSDEGMVSVIHRKGGEVTLIVHHAGESNVAVVTGSGISQLHIRARQLADAIQVEISQ